MSGLYLLAAISLIVLIGAGTYALISRYFDTSTDLALHHRMAEQFQLLGVQLPPELAAAEREWYGSRGVGVGSLARSTPTSTSPVSKQGEEGESDAEERC
jgi:hypothetical protein